MSIQIPTERQLRRAEAKAEHRARKELYESRKAENLTPERAFRLITNRIIWLNHKIDVNRAAGKGYEMFIQEREALIWMMDKVKEMSERLLSIEEKVDTARREERQQVGQEIFKEMEGVKYIARESFIPMINRIITDQRTKVHRD